MRWNRQFRFYFNGIGRQPDLAETAHPALLAPVRPMSHMGVKLRPWAAALHIFNDDPHYTKLYFENYLPMNPMFPAVTFMEEGMVHTSGNILPQEELEKTPLLQGVDRTAIAVNLETGRCRRPARES
jgi:hypothetical protein